MPKLIHVKKCRPFVDVTDESVLDVIDLISCGESPRSAHDSYGCISPSSFHRHLAIVGKDSFLLDKYYAACESRAEMLVWESHAEAGNRAYDYDAEGRGNTAAVKRSELIIKTNQWLAQVMKPKRFGQKADITSNGDKIGGAPVFVLHDPAAQQAIEQVIDAVTKD